MSLHCKLGRKKGRRKHVLSSSQTGARVDQMDQHRFGIVTLVRKFWGGLRQFVEQEEGRGWRGRRRRRAWKGKVPDTELDWEMTLKFPLLSPQETPAEEPEGDPCPKAQIKPLGTRNVNMKSLASHGAWGFDCNPLRVPKAIIHGLCTKSGVGREAFPVRTARQKLL